VIHTPGPKLTFVGVGTRCFSNWVLRDPKSVKTTTIRRRQERVTRRERNVVIAWSQRFRRRGWRARRESRNARNATHVAGFFFFLFVTKRDKKKRCGGEGRGRREGGDVSDLLGARGEGGGMIRVCLFGFFSLSFFLSFFLSFLQTTKHNVSHWLDDEWVWLLKVKNEMVYNPYQECKG
jgi:hypothetical protein